ncbi:MAG TPA: hypothetical protein IAA98_02155, partial [Candidatus Avipropionibacterium avicola]|nr:hypothetical protein [Candidatus Avipropionibacterium avicola]
PRSWRRCSTTSAVGHQSWPRPWRRTGSSSPDSRTGGLAAAALAVTRPDLVGGAVAQSGSFWFRAGQEPSGPRELTEAGDLIRWLRKRSTNRSSRIAVQVGSEEGDMVTQARWFTEAARGTGHRVHHREHRGGHDYAWWFPALDEGLAALATM